MSTTEDYKLLFNVQIYYTALKTQTVPEIFTYEKQFQYQTHKKYDYTIIHIYIKCANCDGSHFEEAYYLFYQGDTPTRNIVVLCSSVDRA